MKSEDKKNVRRQEPGIIRRQNQEPGIISKDYGVSSKDGIEQRR